MKSIGAHIEATGCFTEWKSIKRAIHEPERLERLLGFQRGRLAKGYFVASFTKVPAMDQFDLAGYTQVSTDRFEEENGKGGHEALKPLAMAKFRRLGSRNLVKVFPTDRTMYEYPPGLGIPQWQIKKTMPMNMKVIATYDGKEFKSAIAH